MAACGACRRSRVSERRISTQAARALIGGLSRATGRAQIVRAVLEGIAFRCGEVIEALRADAPDSDIDVLRVDGGAARNDFLMQCQADVSGVPIERPMVFDAACLGAAYLAGLATGFWKDIAEVGKTWRRDRIFEPRVERRRASCSEPLAGRPSSISLAISRESPAVRSDW